MGGELFQALFEQAPAALCVFDANLKTVFSNAAFRVLFDAPPEEALALVPLALKGEAQSLPVKRYPVKNGRAVLTVSAVPLMGTHALLAFADAAPAERLGILADASEEFAASRGDVLDLLELVAKRLGERLDAFATLRLLSRDGQTLEIGGATWHKDPELARVSRQLVLDYPQRVGEGMSGLVAQTGEPMLIPKLDPELVAARTAERLRPVVLNLGLTCGLAVPLRARGRIIGVLSLGRGRDGASFTKDDLQLAQDLADRAGLAVENALLLADLELRVQERTAQLTLANRELEAFSYSVSHDLRAPLRSIDGFSAVLEQEQLERLDENGKDALARVRRAAKRMGQLIDDLLSLSRIQKEPLERVPVDLSRIAQTVVSDLKRCEPAREVAFAVTPDVEGLCDPRLIRVVLENLLSNAWKFTSKREGALITFGRSEADGAFFVNDNGAGFEMKYVSRLFNPFQRLHPEKDYPGTGVGLATVQRIIARHGGRVWASGELGKGATFFFTLG